MSGEETLMFLLLLTGQVAAHGDEFSLADEVEGRAVGSVRDDGPGAKCTTYIPSSLVLSCSVLPGVQQPAISRTLRKQSSRSLNVVHSGLSSCCVENKLKVPAFVTDFLALTTKMSRGSCNRR